MRSLIIRLAYTVYIIIINATPSSGNMKISDEIPEPVVPVYQTLKDLHLTTSIADDHQSQIAIIAPLAYSSESRSIQATIKKLTGVNISILSDEADGGFLPLKSNLIVLGNRSTNSLISELYDSGFTLLDLKYPGPNGYVVRSLHNPFGNGKNVLFVGGSDYDGIKLATVEFIKLLNDAGTKPGSMSIGYFCKITLGKGYKLPENIVEAEIWEASEWYGSSGFFGWNMISKSMALYYMTNKERYLKEFLRLAFPDEAAISEIEKVDGEAIENKKDPLSGPYHYSAYMMIEMWELIEESPLLNDELRLKITNAFARQLSHRVAEGVYWTTSPPDCVGDRHSDWSAFSLYALGRYFQKDYPSPVWKHCMTVADMYFSALKNTYWIAGETDHLFWFTSFYDPILNYLLYSGKRDAEMLKNLRLAMNTQQIISTGLPLDWGLKSSSLSMLNKAAHILKDGRWLYFREHINLKTDVFRLGQSFWPDSLLKPDPPVDLLGKWNIQWMAMEMWRNRSSGIAKEKSFRWGSYRSELGRGGDFILLKGYNGAGRNPYHTFDILELRLNGATLLKGHHNQVLTSVDGLVEPKVPMDAKLLYRDVIGKFTAAVAEVPDQPFANWKRSLVLNKRQYVLIADELVFRYDNDNFLSETTWEMPGATWLNGQHVVNIQPSESEQSAYILKSSEMMVGKERNGIITMKWRAAVKKDQKRNFFYLLGEKGRKLNIVRITDHAAALALPEAGVVVTGHHQGILADLAVLSENTLYGHRLLSAGIEHCLLKTNVPVEVDWEFNSGRIMLESQQMLKLKLAILSPVIFVNGRRRKGKLEKGMFTFNLPAGKYDISNAIPKKNNLGQALTKLMNVGKQALSKQVTQKISEQDISIPGLNPIMEAALDAKPVNGIVIPSPLGDLVGLGAGNTVTLLASTGKIVRKLTTPDTIRVIHWWAEHKLLLVGCADERVIAFDELGQKKWEYISVMDRAVYEAGKQYWFKKAYPGVQGLYSGLFDNGKSRAFVGSACTLEILDENGQLIKRLPVFWGSPRQFLLVDLADGVKQLLAGRWQSDRPNLAVINSRTMKVERFGYDSVPEGHTFVNGWMVMNRFDNFLVDLNGDGNREVISAINGTWNRITIYSEDGKPLYNAQVGPGNIEPRSNIRMMDVGDLNGDGELEIMVALSSGLVDILDNKARLLWAKQFSNPPTILKLVSGPGIIPWLCVGLEDGTVLALDAKGKILKQSLLKGKPVDIQVLPTAEEPVVVITTENGNVSGYRFIK